MQNLLPPLSLSTAVLQSKAAYLVHHDDEQHFGEDPQGGEAVLVYSALCDAMESSLVAVEAVFVRGFSGLALIGNATEVSRNGVERARSALERLGITVPDRKIVVSLSPAELKKDGSQFDLAFALCIAQLLTKSPPAIAGHRWLFAAELSLNGNLRPVRNIASFALTAITSGLEGIVIAHDNLPEVREVLRVGKSSLREITVLSFATLGEIWHWLLSGISLPAYQDKGHSSHYRQQQQQGREALSPQGLNFDDMELSPELELAATVLAAGLHSMLLYGAPGTGKSMFANRVTSIFPLMDEATHLEALRIHSAVAENLAPSLLAGQPPLRSPHHQCSAPALMGVPEVPGEISLAHGGVLFLDEFPEFRRDLIEALREPLEIGSVRVSRAKRKVVWKAEVTLVAACNLCPCGWFGSELRHCTCPLQKILSYRRKISGPILDRLDLHINTPEQEGQKSRLFSALLSSPGPSKRMREVVLQARERSRKRNQGFGVLYNRDLAAKHLLSASGLAESVFMSWVDALFPRSSSNRGTVKALKVARSIADIAGREVLHRADIEQAVKWQAHSAAQARGEQALGLCD